MVHRVFVFIAALLLSSSLLALPDLSGIWMLNLPDSEEELLLTAEGLRIQQDYDLLSDDPSLYCTPASASRIWANPNSAIKIEQTPEQILISYELFDLRREIPIGDASVMSEKPSTQNLEGTYFQEMGSSFAHYADELLVIESRKHAPGYIRTSRGIPQSAATVALEEIGVEGDTLHIKHTYIDDILFEKPFVLDYTFHRVDDIEIAVYACTDADYDWFNELNAKKEDGVQ
jgi:hypothetical protein